MDESTKTDHEHAEVGLVELVLSHEHLLVALLSPVLDHLFDLSVVVDLSKRGPDVVEREAVPVSQP